MATPEIQSTRADRRGSFTSLGARRRQAGGTCQPSLIRALLDCAKLKSYDRTVRTNFKQEIPS